MTLRCRPNDLALVTGETWVERLGVRIAPIVRFGTVVQVLRIRDGDCWEIAEPIPVELFGERYIVTALGDSVLTPLPRDAAPTAVVECETEFNFG